MKRIVLLLCLFLVASGLIFAGSQGEATGDKKIVRMYPQGLAPREAMETDRIAPPKAFWEVQKEYEQLNPNVQIEFLENLPSGYEEWFSTQMTGGTAPEIVWYQRGYIQRDYQKGWLSSLSNELDNTANPYTPGNKAWYDIFQEPVIESGRAPNDEIYMITGDIVGTGIFYNKDIFAEVGVEVPETWDDFLQVQAKVKSAGYIPFSISMALGGGIELWGSWTTRELQDVFYNDKMEYLKGGPVERTWKPGQNLPTQDMVKAIKDGRYSAKDEEFKEIFLTMKEWSQYWPEGYWALPSDDVFPLWIQGKAAMGWFGSWLNKSINNDPLREFEWGVFEKLPTITKASSEFGGSPFPAMAGVGGVFQYAISEQTTTEFDNFAETVDWMKYITNPETLIKLLNDHGGFAPGTKVTTGADPTLSIYTDQMVKYGTERIEPFDSMLTREFYDNFWKLIQQYLGDQIDIEKLTDEIQKEFEEGADQLLAENPDWK